MANWTWNTSKGKRYLRIYAADETGKVKPLPRSEIAHLDGKSEHEIQDWVDWYTKNRELPRISITHKMNPDLAHYVDSYLKEMRDNGKNHKTILDHKKSLYEYIIPFFRDTEPHAPDPNDWPEKSAKFKSWMRGLGREQGQLSEDKMIKANTALTKFWAYLCEERVVRYNTLIFVKKVSRTDRVTPLQKSLDPEEVLTLYEKSKAVDPQVALMGLVTYFFSIRPQELFALRRKDFKGGKDVLEFQDCKNLNEAGLFGLLAVKIHRQRYQNPKYESGRIYEDGTPLEQGYAPVKGAPEGPLKNTWLGCIDEQAARYVVEAIADMEPEQLLFPDYNDLNFTKWRESGFKIKDGREVKYSFTLKDLRRAVTHWLGHNSKLKDVQLQLHSRHKNLETTQRYMRNPVERGDKEFDLDLTSMFNKKTSNSA